MSEIKVNSIKGVGASSAAITVNNTDGTCTANLTNKPNRNLIINGAMQVAARGLSATGSATSGQFQVDRFQTRADNTDNASFTHAQVTDAPSGTGFSKSFKLSVDTAETTLDANENVYIVQKIEGQNVQQLAYGSSSAKKVTLSFYVKSYQTGNFTIALYKDDSQASVITSTYTVSQSGTWEKKTITFDGLTTSGIVDDNGNGLAVYWHLAAGSNYTSGSSTTWGNYSDARFAVGQSVNFLSSTNNYFQITGVQLEVGSVATDFEHRSFAQELELCKRYYQQPINGTGQDIAPCAFYYSANHIVLTSPIVTPMRTTPTVTVTQGTNYYKLFSSANASGEAFQPTPETGTPVSYSFYDNSGVSGTAGVTGFARTQNASAKIEYSAEL